jgi:hypothetical protein
MRFSVVLAFFVLLDFKVPDLLKYIVSLNLVFIKWTRNGRKINAPLEIIYIPKLPYTLFISRDLIMTHVKQLLRPFVVNHLRNHIRVPIGG